VFHARICSSGFFCSYVASESIGASIVVNVSMIGRYRNQ
jgi:hypothetical protein